MNPLNILKALELMLVAVEAFERTTTQLRGVIGTARAEGRDITDAELAGLRANNDQLLTDLKARIGL